MCLHQRNLFTYLKPKVFHIRSEKESVEILIRKWYNGVGRVILSMIATHRVKDSTGNTVGFIVDFKKEV